MFKSSPDLKLTLSKLVIKYKFRKVSHVVCIKSSPKESFLLFLQLSSSGPLICFLMMCMLVHFLRAVTKCLTRNNVREEGFIKGIWSIMACKTWQQGPQVTGHAASTVRKPGVMNAGTQHALSFFSPGPQPTKWCHARLAWVFSLPVAQPRQSLADMPRDLSSQGSSHSCQVGSQY